MSTLTGLKVEKGIDAVVLAADLSGTAEEWLYTEKKAHKQETRTESVKFIVDPNEKVLIGTSGYFDELYTRLLCDMIKYPKIIKKAIKTGKCPELRNINLRRLGRYYPNADNVTNLLIATRFDNHPNLYHFYPLGAVEMRFFDALGSGAQFAIRRFRKEGKPIPVQLDLESGIRRQLQCLDSAYEDIYTSGLDLWLVTPEGIYNPGEQIRDKMKEAKEQGIRETIEQYSSPRKPSNIQF